MKQIIFNYDYLRAAMPHTANRDVRFYLQGVYLGDGFMAATDGHRLIMINDECFAGCDHIIPREAVDFFIKKCKNNPISKEVTLTMQDDGFNILELLGNYEYFKFIDGKFPQVQRVDIPKPEKSEGNPQFNIAYMNDFLKSLKILSGSNHHTSIKITTNNNQSAYVDLTDNAHGIIMPLRD
jgi:DNA polymerase III sliding clamp (beta) subunit (PCNA family)